MYRHCTSPHNAPSSGTKHERCAYNFGSCAAPASYARCQTDADCDSLNPNHKGHLTCDGLPIRCNTSYFCTNGHLGGELCNTTAGEPGSSHGGRSVGPDCAGPNDGLLEVSATSIVRVQMACIVTELYLCIFATLLLSCSPSRISHCALILLQVQMAVSSDGFTFKRVSRMAFVARGSGRSRPGTPGVWKGDFDAASTAVAVGTIDSGDETLMYEIGWQYTHGGYAGFAPQPGGPVLSGIRLLRLRRHGFVSLRAEGEDAVMMSKPLRLPVCNSSKPDLVLILNLQTSLDGVANVSLVDASNQTVLTAVPFVGNNVAARMQWVMNATATTEVLPREAHGHVLQLRVGMAYSDLYSFQFDCFSGVAQGTRLKSEDSMLESAVLPTLLTIDWQRLPDVPAQGHGFAGKAFYGHGFQNSDGGWLTQDTVVTAFGHGGGTFLNNGWLVNVTTALALGCRGGPNCSDTSWRQLPPAPVSGRQDVASAIINGSVYIVGGFSYSAPYTFSDFLRLRFHEFPVGWQWERLPNFPYPVCMHGVASIGSKLFVQGGADTGGADAFHNFHDHKGKVAGLGQRLYVYDTADAKGGWVRLPDNPGPPRANAALSSVAGSLFLIGGMSFVPSANTTSPQSDSARPTPMTTVDNWRYDPKQVAWHRLPDLPVASGNFQTNGCVPSIQVSEESFASPLTRCAHRPMTAYGDRYIILIGGYQYPNTYYVNKSVGSSYGTTQRMCPSAGVGVGCRPHCTVDMPNITCE